MVIIMTNHDPYDLKREINLFKTQMKEVNDTLFQYENDFKLAKDKVDRLRESFVLLIKVMNHELVEVLTKSNRIIKRLESTK